MFDINVSMPDDFHVSVETTLNRGWTPEEVAHRCANKLMEVSENAPPVIRDQAEAFKRDIEKTIALYMREAIKSDRTTIFNTIKNAGYPDLAESIRRL
tara:strand:- start:31 stop:324 length:294 start_codon:yes stop_codon:yes gene_type:complete